MSDRARQHRTSQRLGSLEAFRADVWGNNDIFKKQGSETQILQYLEFGKHLAAVRDFCKAVHHDKILVVKEYEEAMMKFKSEIPRYKRGACIVGQPGIGKSTFIVYAVIERLREKQPVAVQASWHEYKGEYLLFHQDGVELYGDSDDHPLAERPGIWAFSDSDQFVDIPAMVFQNTPGVRVFQTTSPATKRWKQWTKQTGVNLYVMDLWSDKDIKDLAWLSGHNDDRMKELADKWGPVPRALLQMLKDPEYLLRHQRLVDAAIRRAATHPQEALDSVLSLNSPDDLGPSILFFVRPLIVDKAVIRGDLSVYPPTPWLTCELADALMVHEEDVKIAFFNSMASHPNARTTAGWIFERFVHSFLVRGDTFTIDWYGKDADSEDITFTHLEASHTIIDLKSDPPFYWKPDATNYPGIDGAVFTKDCVYVLQATISHDHTSPQVGVDRLWKSVPREKKILPWKFLFIGVVARQTWNASMTYASTLHVGDPSTRANDKGIPKSHLPVGRVSVRPTKIDFKYIDYVDELRRLREREDHPEEAGTEVASEMARVEAGEGPMDTS